MFPCDEFWCRSDMVQPLPLQAMRTLRAAISIVTWTLKFSSTKVQDKACRSAQHDGRSEEWPTPTTFWLKTDCHSDGYSQPIASIEDSYVKEICWKDPGCPRSL